MLRIITRIVAYVFGGLATFAVLLFAIVYVALQPSRDQVLAVTSPDGRLVAKLIEVNGGATTSFGYTVVLAESQAAHTDRVVANLYGAVRNASAYGVNLRWTSPDELAIEYLQAQSSDLLSSKSKVGGREVRVALRPNVTDPTAPAGGMLYNLQGHPQ